MDPDPNEPKPIDYRDGKDDAPQGASNAGRFVFGGVAGAAVVAFVGFIAFLGLLGTLEQYPRQPVPRPWGRITFFAVIAIVGFMFGISLIRKPRRRFLLAGFLIGVGVCALCEGICFSGMR